VFDVLLAAYIAIFCFLKAYMLQRETLLGWSMSLFNVVIGIAFVRIVVEAFLPDANTEVLLIPIRVTLAASVTFCIYALLSHCGDGSCDAPTQSGL
jgi:hypothetical protein